jgi:hypothetical protein
MDPKQIENLVKGTKAPAKSPAKKVRARDDKGRLKGDDPSTPDVNEAWVQEAKPMSLGDNKKQGVPESK